MTYWKCSYCGTINNSRHHCCTRCKHEHWSDFSGVPGTFDEATGQTPAFHTNDAPRKSGNSNNSLLIGIIIALSVVVVVLLGVIVFWRWLPGMENDMDDQPIHSVSASSSTAALALLADGASPTAVQSASATAAAVTATLMSSPTAMSASTPENRPIVSLTVGQYVSFGHYEQNAIKSDGREAINWQVLDVQDDRALLLAEQVLDCRPLNHNASQPEWSTSSLRAWLNGEFLQEAFVSSERNALLPEPLNHDNVFLLSIEEVEQYLPSTSQRVVLPTAYAMTQGVYTGDKISCPWWIRSYDIKHPVVVIGREGNFYLGDQCTDNRNGVRPAVWVKLSSNVLSDTVHTANCIDDVPRLVSYGTELIQCPSSNLAVYTGPGEEYYRSASSKAIVGNGERVIVYGRIIRDGREWILIQYNGQSNGQAVTRFAYAPADNVTYGSCYPEIDLALLPIVIDASAPLADEPSSARRGYNTIDIHRNSAYAAASILDEDGNLWVYFCSTGESSVNGGQVMPVYGFVPARYVTFR
ncbi:MAG: DUF6273 domain-containing protein [Aristaeellaceae bacterium]